MKFIPLALLVLGLLMIGASWRLFLGQGDKPVVGMWLFFTGATAAAISVMWLLALAFVAI